MLNRFCFRWIGTVALVAGVPLSSFAQDAGRAKPSSAESFAENLTDRTMSAAKRRHVVDDSENELYTRFRYSPVQGLGYEPPILPASSRKNAARGATEGYSDVARGTQRDSARSKRIGRAADEN